MTVTLISNSLLSEYNWPPGLGSNQLNEALSSDRLVNRNVANVTARAYPAGAGPQSRQFWNSGLLKARLEGPG